MTSGESLANHWIFSKSHHHHHHKYPECTQQYRSSFLTVHKDSPITIPLRTNPLPKPHRTGDYGHHHHGHDQGQEMADYGPASYVPGDR